MTTNIYKRNIVLTVSILASQIITNLSFSQIKPTQIVKHNDLKYQSVEIMNGIWDNGFHWTPENDIGTAFIVKFGPSYFLVTALHLLCNRRPYDTVPEAYNYIKGKTADCLAVNFYNTKGTKSTHYYSLYAGGRKLFRTANPSPNNKILDLAFFILKDVPNDAVIDPIDLYNIDSTFRLPKKSKLLIYGFLGDASRKLEFPLLNTATTVDDFSISYRDKYIFCDRTIDFQGNSGGPVYFKKSNGKSILVGMVSWETRSKYEIFKQDEMSKIKTPKCVYEFVSVMSIRKEFENIFFKK